MENSLYFFLYISKKKNFLPVDFTVINRNRKNILLKHMKFYDKNILIYSFILRQVYLNKIWRKIII